jgi:putative oxidoreductase
MEPSITANPRDRKTTAAEIFVRLALAAGFLSAVADRFGLWGPPGAPNVVWGAWQPFIEYVALLNGFAPPSLHPALGWIATIAEVVIALGLLIGWRLRWFAMASGVLLLIFALAMVIALGLKPPLDYSVLAAAAASFLLAARARDHSTSS